MIKKMRFAPLRHLKSEATTQGSSRPLIYRIWLLSDRREFGNADRFSDQVTGSACPGAREKVIAIRSDKAHRISVFAESAGCRAVFPSCEQTICNKSWRRSAKAIQLSLNRLMPAPARGS